MNVPILTAAVVMSFVLVATGAPMIASAQYLGSGDQVGVDQLNQYEGSAYPPEGYGSEMSIHSLAPFITFLILGIVAGGIAAVFFIKGRSYRHTAVGKG